jgi:twitching motility two-component system response regulator PilG
MNAEISFEGIKVVVVDDGKTTRRIVKSLLEKAGGEVITATDGFESLAKVMEHQPDIIFLDIMMPRLDGFQTCALIKNHPAFKTIPVVMLSTKCGFERAKIERAYSRIVGADHYMSKPISREELFNVVKTYVVDAKTAGERMTKTPTHIGEVAEHLETKEDMAAYLDAALQENDPALVVVALSNIARAKGMTQIAGDTGLGRDSLQALSSGSPLEFATVLKVVQTLGLKLHASVISKRLSAVYPA